MTSLTGLEDHKCNCFYLYTFYLNGRIRVLFITNNYIFVPFIYSVSLYLFYINVDCYRPLFSVSWIFISCLGKHSCHICKGLTAHSWSWSPFMQIESHKPGQAKRLMPFKTSRFIGKKKVVAFWVLSIHCCVFVYLRAWI